MGTLIRNALFTGLTGLLLAGCLTAYGPEDGTAMTRAEMVEAANAWYGLLLNPADEKGRVGVSVRRETIQVLDKEAKHWRKWRKKVARSLRKSSSPRQDFYAGIETNLPMETLLASRSRLQAELVETSPQKEKEAIELYTLAAEHAVLTERVIRLGNGVAKGEIKGQAFLDAVGTLKMFRSEFRPILSKKLPLVENQERETFDITGMSLLKTIGSDQIRVDFFDAPHILNESAANAENADEKSENGKWEKVTRLIFPAVSPGSGEGGETTFRLSAPALEKINDQSSFSLVFWEAVDSFSVTLNGRNLGVVERATDGQSVFLPVEKAALATPEDTFVLTFSLPGKQSSLPFRAVFLTVAE